KYKLSDSSSAGCSSPLPSVDKDEGPIFTPKSTGHDAVIRSSWGSNPTTIPSTRARCGLRGKRSLAVDCATQGGAKVRHYALSVVLSTGRALLELLTATELHLDRHSAAQAGSARRDRRPAPTRGTSGEACSASTARRFDRAR